MSLVSAEPFEKEQHSPGGAIGDDKPCESHVAAPPGTGGPKPPRKHQRSRSGARLEEGEGPLHGTEGWSDAEGVMQRYLEKGTRCQHLHDKSLCVLQRLERARTSEEKEVWLQISRKTMQTWEPWTSEDWLQSLSTQAFVGRALSGGLMQRRGSGSWLHGSLHHAGSAGDAPRVSTHPA